MKKEILILILIIIFSFPAFKNLLIPGGYTSHDLTHHIVRQIDMDKLLKEGQLPPRWSGDLNNGYGYPVFLFNYPFPAMVGEIFHGLGFNFLYSVKALLFLSLILSPIGMYLFLRSYLGSSLASFLGAMFYLYSPHRFLNIYVSAALGSAFGDAILPFVFWCLVELKKTGKQFWLVLGSLLFALLITSHNLTTLIFSPLLLAFSGVLIFESKERLKTFRNLSLMFILGLCLSAWFWMPALFEKHYLVFDSIFKDFYKDQFPTLKQLIGSKWGFGLSHPQNPGEGDLSYQIGLVHILVMIFLIFTTFIFKRIKAIGVFILFFFLLSLFFILEISKPFWDNLPLLNAVQFPWRFSAIAVFVSSIGAGLLIKYLPSKKLMFTLFLILVIYANRNHWKINQVFDPGEDYYLSLKTTTTSFNEHLPKWGRVMPKFSPGKLEFLEGGGNIKYLENKSATVLAEVEATTSSKLRFNQFYFPGWEIKVNDKKVNFDYLKDGENYGLPNFDIDKGRSRIEAEFKNAPDRNIAGVISILGVILWVMLLCKLLLQRIFQVKRSS